MPRRFERKESREYPGAVTDVRRKVGLALGISEHTAKAHVRSILEKLESADRAEAVARGFELGVFHVD